MKQAQWRSKSSCHVGRWKAKSSQQCSFLRSRCWDDGSKLVSFFTSSHATMIILLDRIADTNPVVRSALSTYGYYRGDRGKKGDENEKEKGTGISTSSGKKKNKKNKTNNRARSDSFARTMMARRLRLKTWDFNFAFAMAMYIE